MIQRMRTIQHRKSKSAYTTCNTCGKQIKTCRRCPYGNYYCKNTCGRKIQRRIHKAINNKPVLKAFLERFPMFISYISPKELDIDVDFDMNILPRYCPHLTKKYVHNSCVYLPAGLRSCHHCRSPIAATQRTRYFREHTYCNKCNLSMRREFSLYELCDRELYRIIDAYPNVIQYLRSDIKKWILSSYVCSGIGDAAGAATVQPAMQLATTFN